MASSGSMTSNAITFSRAIRFEWWVISQNIAENKTRIGWQVLGTGGDSTTWVNGQNFRGYINGTYWTSLTNRKVYYGTIIKTGEMDIPHNADGTKTFSSNLMCEMYYYGSDNTTASGSWALPTIPRQANIEIANDFNDEGLATFTYSNNAGNSVTELMAALYWSDGTVLKPYTAVGKIGTLSYTFSFTEAERKTLRTKLSTVNSATVDYMLRTLIGGIYYYSKVTRTITIINNIPTITSFAIQDTNSVTTNLTGNNQKFIFGYSKLRIYSIVATPKKEATLKSIIINDETAPWVTGYEKTISYWWTNKINMKVVDSRNNISAVSTKTIDEVIYNGIDYNYENTSTLRTNNLIGEQVTLKVDGLWSNVNFGRYTNIISATYRYRRTGTTTWTTGLTTLTVSKSGDTFSINQLIRGDLASGFTKGYNFDIEVIVVDRLETFTIKLDLLPSDPLLSMQGNQLGIGGKLDNTLVEQVQLRQNMNLGANYLTNFGRLYGSNNYLIMRNVGNGDIVHNAQGGVLWLGKAGLTEEATASVMCGTKLFDNRDGIPHQFVSGRVLWEGSANIPTLNSGSYNSITLLDSIRKYDYIFIYRGGLLSIAPSSPTSTGLLSVSMAVSTSDGLNFFMCLLEYPVDNNVIRLRQNALAGININGTSRFDGGYAGVPVTRIIGYKVT